MDDTETGSHFKDENSIDTRERTIGCQRRSQELCCLGTIMECVKENRGFWRTSEDGHDGLPQKTVRTKTQVIESPSFVLLKIEKQPANTSLLLKTPAIPLQRNSPIVQFPIIQTVSSRVQRDALNVPNTCYFLMFFLLICLVRVLSFFRFRWLSLTVVSTHQANCARRPSENGNNNEKESQSIRRCQAAGSEFAIAIPRNQSSERKCPLLSSLRR